MEHRKNINFNLGAWNYQYYYIIPQQKQVPPESEQDIATDRIIEATLAGMEEFPEVKKVLDRISSM